LVPDQNTGARALFEDLVLEAGCRHVMTVRLLFEANYRRSKCITLRDDAVVTQLPSHALAAALLAAPPGTIAVMGFDQVMDSGGNLVALSLDGVMPSPSTISSLEYEQTRTLYIYAKRQHGRSEQGVGVVRGIREFLMEGASEAASGPGGYLALVGLVPLGPAERAAQRRIAEHQTLMAN
jgi:phosphate transport system substrate-binding protein